MARLRLRHSQQWCLLQDLPVQSISMILGLHLGRWCKVHRLGAGVKLGIIFAVLPTDVDMSNILIMCGVLT